MAKGKKKRQKQKASTTQPAAEEPEGAVGGAEEESAPAEEESTHTPTPTHVVPPVQASLPSQSPEAASGHGRGIVPKGRGRGRGDVRPGFGRGQQRADEVSLGQQMQGLHIKEESHKQPTTFPSTQEPQRHPPAPTESPRRQPPQRGQPAPQLVNVRSAPVVQAGLLPPSRKKHGGPGKEGRPIVLKTNFFHINMNKLAGTIFHYDVDIKPDRPKKLYRAILEKLKMNNPEVKSYFPVFDGRKNIYTARQLPFSNSKEFDVEVEDFEDEPPRKLKFKVTIKFAATVNTHTITEYFERGHSTSPPSDALQALDIMLREVPSIKFTPVGRSFFSDAQGVVQIGEGCEMWTGHYQSIRLAWKPMINIDLSFKAFHKPTSVLEKIYDILGGDRFLVKGLSYYELERVSKELKGLKIQYARGDGSKRNYRVNGLTDKSARQQTFEEQAGKMSTVEDFFLRTYQKRLKHPNLPCLWIGSRQRTIYVPMELCSVMKNQPQNKKLTDRQTATMIRSTAIPAPERLKKTLEKVRNMDLQRNPFMKEFGISIADTPTRVEGRVLPPPKLRYGTDQQKQIVVPRDGVWDMRRNKFVAGAEMKCWGLLNYAWLKDFNVNNFVESVCQTGSQLGMRIDMPLFVKNGMEVRNLQNDMRGVFKNYKNLQIIMVILNEREKMYSKVKHIGDVELGLMTACVQAKNVQKNQPQTISNICLKLNSKLGGINNSLETETKPPVFNKPVIIFGADVTHPAAEYRGVKPSLAAVVASMDAKPSSYAHEISVQRPGIEIIDDLQNITVRLLKQFKEKTAREPQKIIFFRDGVSEGQFDVVLQTEVTALRKACLQLNPTYKPGITFLVVQKRHHTRFYADNLKDTVGRSQNVPPGTTIDTEVVHPTEFDYYLCSHQGIQGTSKPAHYHVLWDDNNFSADELQKLTYYLCHTFVRCTRSVSYPAPCYYAHLAAFRARNHHDNFLDSQGYDRQRPGQREEEQLGGDLETAKGAVAIHRDMSRMYFA